MTKNIQMIMEHNQIKKPDDSSAYIENIKKGDKIRTFDRHAAAVLGSGLVTKINKRKADKLFKVVIGDNIIFCDAQQRWLVRWINRTDESWATYVMSKDNKYRVGQIKMFRKVPNSIDRLNFGLGSRVNVERADNAWILKVHKTFSEALAYEQILSVRYGLPEIVFHEPYGVLHFKQNVIDSVYAELGDLKENAIACLTDHGRDIAYPFHVRRGRLGRQTLFEIETINLLPEFMAAPTHTDKRMFEWTPIQAVKPLSKPGMLYSLSVEPHQKFIVNGVITSAVLAQPA